MKKIIAMLTTGIILLSLIGCSMTSVAGAPAGMETDNGWMSWKLEGKEESGSCTVEIEDKEDDYVKANINLKKGTLHLLVTDEKGEVLYETTSDQDDTEVKIENTGSINLSYDTKDAEGEFTLYYNE